MRQISIFETEPQLDTMPVFKTTNYPWTEDSFRPLAYARAAFVGEEGLLVDLQAFERDPECADADLINNSCVAISLEQDSGEVLTVIFNATGRYQACRGGQPFDLPLDVHCYAGDDEQGWYWGVRFYLPVYCSQEPDAQGAHMIKGNIYKFKRVGEDAHMGAVAPMRSESIFSEENLDDFLIVDY